MLITTTTNKATGKHVYQVYSVTNYGHTLRAVMRTLAGAMAYARRNAPNGLVTVAINY